MNYWNKDRQKIDEYTTESSSFIKRRNNLVLYHIMLYINPKYPRLCTKLILTKTYQ